MTMAPIMLKMIIGKTTHFNPFSQSLPGSDKSVMMAWSFPIQRDVSPKLVEAPTKTAMMISTLRLAAKNPSFAGGLLDCLLIPVDISDCW
mmetsp:Transcript_57756/g.148583  ORF Transcript_57756/g.148583 Transcript_57756/m.148583 type:complete len:90 (+) Transcript_57756:1733-2002(+)